MTSAKLSQAVNPLSGTPNNASVPASVVQDVEDAVKPSSTNSVTKESVTPQPPWVEIHEAAMQEGLSTYIDPTTGYSVFTAKSHLDRGYCCGNKCRHCPYDHENVGNPDKLKAQKAQARIDKQRARDL